MALCLPVWVEKNVRKYLSTFVSTQSGRQNAMTYFLDNKDDAARMVIFIRHTDLWSDISSDVKAFTLANWDKWEREKPAWFDENFKANVPDEFIPKAALKALNKKGGGSRRRSSAGLLLIQQEDDKNAGEK